MCLHRNQRASSPQAPEWERSASLRLRASDPGVLAEYDLRARIVGGDEADMEDTAFAAAAAERWSYSEHLFDAGGGPAMLVQRVVAPVSGVVSWTVVDEHFEPVGPAEAYLAHLFCGNSVIVARCHKGAP